MEPTKPLIQEMKESGEFSQLEEKPLRTYYTCVRYSNVPISTPVDTGLPFPTIYYGPGQWSCMKGWFEPHDNTFRKNTVDTKVLNYCKFRDTVAALQKDIGQTFIMVNPKSSQH